MLQALWQKLLTKLFTEKAKGDRSHLIYLLPSYLVDLVF